MKICLSCEGVSETPAERCGFCGAWLLPADAVHYPVRRGEVDAANPLLGTVIDGKYRLLGVLGRGGLGTVFRAQHTGSLMHVALKLLHPRFGERPEYRRALVPEARRAATVAHERCARLLDVGEAEDGAAYLVMELAEGRTLDLLVRDGALAPGHAVAILEQVADALAAIHAVGLVHCDLSPRNVMVAASGGALRVKVLDFGIARSVALAGQARSHGEFHGFVNPAFSAPELLAGRDVDARADLYSFGTLAWLLLTGGMPVDDTDVRKAAAAVLAGDLRPWPEPRGVGRRLRRLVLRCLQKDPAQRPPSVAAVARELAIVHGPRPALTRAGALTTALGVVAMFATARPTSAPFLQTVAGAPFALAAGPREAAPAVVDTTSERLATVRFDYAGFAPRRLRVHIVRDGAVLLRVDQAPEPEAGGGTLALSSAQAPWRTVVEGLARTGREHASDVVFLLPGAAPFGSARLRVDDAPPVVAAGLATPGGTLRVGTRLTLDVRDEVGVAAVTVRVRAGGRVVELPAPPTGGAFALGAALADQAPELAGPCDVEVVARDRAGNAASAGPVAFAAVDVRAPRVVAVTGPQGEPFAPLVGGVARVRVRLADVEPGDQLAIQVGDGAPVVVPWPDDAVERAVDVPVAAAQRAAAWRLAARDPAANETARELTPQLRDRSLAIAFPRVDGPARAIAGELVLAAGGRATIAVSDNWTIADVVAETLDGREVADPGFGWERLTPSTARLDVDALPPGAYRLVARLREGDADDALRALATAALRVLPAAIEVRVPAVDAPYLPAFVEAGVLAARGDAGLGAYGEGPAWNVDAGLRPYLRGRATWRAGDAMREEPLPVGDAGCALLPLMRPVRGLNRVSARYFDVLDRPAQLRLGDAVAATDEPAPVVSFWWSDEPPQQVGEEALVEHGRAARVRVRSPLPFSPGDAPALRLGIGQAEVPATFVRVRGRTDAEITFDVPFATWSAAARLADVARDQYAAGLDRRLDVSLATPAGRMPLTLRLRTVRSTLQPLTLADLRPLPPALGALRLLPVLPPTAPFAEPAPADGPPRAAYRVGPKVDVRNLVDVLMLAEEFPVGAARELAAIADGLPGAAACVHADDPRGPERLAPANLLPAGAAAAAADAPLAGVDFFQAYALARLLGLAAAGDAEAMRLPLGVELEIAAFAGAEQVAGHGAAAHGGAVEAAAFVPTVAPAPRSLAVGDVVPSGFEQPFVGLDFGLREWTLDLPSAPGADALLREWFADGAGHLARAQALARGVDDPARAALGPALQLGVVRGLAFVDGALPVALRVPLPASVPGVLRAAQLRRDGRDLLSAGPDPRLAGIGFRVVADVARLGGTEAR